MPLTKKRQEQEQQEMAFGEHGDGSNKASMMQRLTSSS